MGRVVLEPGGGSGARWRMMDTGVIPQPCRSAVENTTIATRPPGFRTWCHSLSAATGYGHKYTGRSGFPSTNNIENKGNDYRYTLLYQLDRVNRIWIGSPLLADSRSPASAYERLLWRKLSLTKTSTCVLSSSLSPIPGESCQRCPFVRCNIPRKKSYSVCH
jgi:hypothetical protein